MNDDGIHHIIIAHTVNRQPAVSHYLHRRFRGSVIGGTRALPCSSTPQQTEADMTPDMRRVASIGR